MSPERSLPDQKEYFPSNIFASSYSIPSEIHPESNEDRTFVLPNNKGFGVFDGVGGGFGGKIASTLAAETISTGFQKLLNNPQLTLNQTAKNIQNILFQANTELIAKRKSMNVREGIETTACIMYIWEGPGGDRKGIIGNIGDSRAYLVDKNREIIDVTLDDRISKPGKPISKIKESKRRELYAQQKRLSEIQDLSDVSPQDQELFHYRHFISQALGQRKIIPSLYFADLFPEDRIMMVSDGVSDNLTDSEMISALFSSTNSLEVARTLVNNALIRSRDINHIRHKPDDMSAVIAIIES